MATFATLPGDLLTAIAMLNRLRVANLLVIRGADIGIDSKLLATGNVAVSSRYASIRRFV